MDLLKRLFGDPSNTLELWQRGDMDGLITALSHPFPWVRRDAAQALGALRNPKSRGALTAALDDRDGAARQAAHDALAQLNDHDLPRR